MAYTPPTNPEDSYELSPFGFGPFPLPGQSVVVAPPHPEGGGYGGVGFLAAGGGVEGGTAYGMGSYGSRWFGRPRVNISGGYGGDPYGLGGYGGTEVTPPYISSAISLNGYEVEVYFSEEVDTTNPALTDPTSYSLQPVLGAAPATVLSVHIEKLGSVNLVAGDTIAGAISVVLTHTGTTQGGLYKAHAYNLTDIAGNPIIDADAPFLAKGEPPSFIVTLPSPDPGNELRVTYSHAMLNNAGYGNLGSYLFEVDPANPYPIDLTALGLQVLSDREVKVQVQGMTSLVYDLTITDAFAFSFDTTDGLVGCVRVDSGTATVTQATSYLVISKPRLFAFSMEWQDTSNTVVPLTSTLRADCTFDFSNVGYVPVITVYPAPEIADITVQDGIPGNGLLVRLTLQYSISGSEQVRIRSGSYDQTVDATWSNGVHTLSFVRNMQAGIVTFLLDEAPLASTQIGNVDGVPETQAGVRFALVAGDWDINGVRVYGCRLSSSTTVYSAAWNFLHDQVVQFTGSAGLTKDRFLTQRGPLVKGWGDATPATEQDVTVLVNGTAVEVADVNPYIGEVIVEIPIPLLPLGESSVSVDYKWFKSPVMELEGLNTPGLVLNKYDCPRRGHHDPAGHGDQIQVPPGSNFLAEPGIPKGAVDIHRFPMGVVLGPMDRPTPLYIGHRYMGFEREYSALINSPTTLLLNQAPGRASVPGFEREVEGVTVAYEGLVRPGVAVPAWALDGSDYGGVDHDAEQGLDLGTYTVLDPLIGEVADDSATVYHRGLDLTYPSSVNLVARLQLSTVLYDEAYPASTVPAGSATVPTAEGVFTGVGFGLHDNRYLYFVGLLRVNGVEHVGLLLNPKRLHEWESWEIGPKSILSASSQTSGTFPSSQVPTGFTVGSRFQILSGTQAGVYTATAVTALCDGTTRVDFSGALPANFDLYGNKYLTAIFETRASAKPFTYRLDIDTDQQVAELRISGETTGVVATIDGNVPPLPLPANSTLLLPREIVGQVFWGSLSRQAASRATWSFIRYGLVPDQVFLRGHAVVINTEMSDLPEDNPLPSGGGVWWPTTFFGASEIMDGEDAVLLRATSSDDAIPMGYGYARVEPFFSPDSIFDLRLKVRIDDGTYGGGIVNAFLDDTSRLVEVAALLVREGLSADPRAYRGLVTLPQVSMSGLVPATEMGWSAESGSTLTGAHEGGQFVTRQTALARGRWLASMDWGTAPQTAQEDEGRVLEARLEVVSSTPNAAGDTGIVFGCQMAYGAGYALVQVELAGTTGNRVVRLRKNTGAPVTTYSFDWSSGVHTYRVLANQVANTVTLVIDDDVQLPAVALASFGGGSDDSLVFFGSTGRDIAAQYDNTISATVEWHYLYCHTQAPADLKRTIGVLKGPGLHSLIDHLDINNFELPRTDTSTAPNSYQMGPAIEWWDWRDDIELRVYRDPGWGVTLFRPDLPLPPYYQPEDGTAGTGFITESDEPSAGWVNVEYRELPRSEGTKLGLIQWGSLRPENLGQSRWDWVRYRLFRHPTEDRIAPQHMVLNQFNVITSGDLGLDKVMETVIVQTMDRTRVTLLPTHIYAASIYKVIDGTTIWTPDYMTFDRASQLITLLPDPLTGEAREFSAEHANVTIMFIPGKPVTNTYLALQPLLDSVTLLNEGTPPVPKNQTANSEYEVVQGSSLNTPADVLNADPEFVLNDPHRTLRHKNVEGSLYEDLEFIEVTNDGQTGLIASICEHGPGQGFSGLAPDEGEDIYSPDGTGDPLGGTGNVADHFATGDKVGKAVGAEVFDFSGTMFWQDANFLPTPDFEQKGGSLGGILFASGGNFVNPMVDANGNILPGQWEAGGGHLGTAVLYPSFPARGPVGGDQGRIYQRTDWFMDIRSVLVPNPGSAGSSGSSGSAGAGDLVDHPLVEDWDTASWGQEATGLLIGGGDYSSYGPWGG